MASSDRGKYEDEAKKNVRSVLLPHSKGLLINDFAREYREFDLPPIQYRKLGFPSLLDLLRAWPDVLEVKEVDGDYRKTLLVGKPDDKTGHVHKMVQRQRESESM